MGMFKRTCWTTPSVVAPDPHAFNVLKVKQVGKLFVSQIKYLTATNLEGMKVLVTQKDPRQMQLLDPHFSEDRNVLARMYPNDAGFASAVEYAKLIQRG